MQQQQQHTRHSIHLVELLEEEARQEGDGGVPGGGGEGGGKGRNRKMQKKGTRSRLKLYKLTRGAPLRVGAVQPLLGGRHLVANLGQDGVLGHGKCMNLTAGAIIGTSWHQRGKISSVRSNLGPDGQLHPVRAAGSARRVGAKHGVRLLVLQLTPVFGTENFRRSRWREGCKVLTSRWE